VDTPDPALAYPAAADLLESRAQALLARWAPGDDGAARVLADVVGSLRRGTVVYAASAVGPVHGRPADSLFAALLDGIGGELGDRGPALALAAKALHRCVAERVRLAALADQGRLLRRVREVSVAERRRTARELHDRIGAGIGSATRNLELYGMFESGEPARATVRVATAQEALRETMYEVRELTADLREEAPAGGVEQALLAHLETDPRPGPAVSVVVNGEERWAAREVRAELFLIVREALDNALAHGGAAQVAVTVDVTPDEVRAVVADDGAGFDVASAGAGIDSMRERAQLLSGHVRLDSSPRHGTRVEVLIPAGTDHTPGSR
jgi:signal transduction histidine kinase